VITYNIFTLRDGSYCDCTRLKFHGPWVHLWMDGFRYVIPQHRIVEIVLYNRGNWFTNMLKSLKEKMRNENLG
jgi:hypothetical protein